MLFIFYVRVLCCIWRGHAICQLKPSFVYLVLVAWHSFLLCAILKWQILCTFPMSLNDCWNLFNYVEMIYRNLNAKYALFSCLCPLRKLHIYTTTNQRPNQMQKKNTETVSFAMCGAWHGNVLLVLYLVRSHFICSFRLLFFYFPAEWPTHGDNFMLFIALLFPLFSLSFISIFFFFLFILFLVHA